MSNNKLKKQPPIAMSATLALASSYNTKQSQYDSQGANSHSSTWLPQRYKGSIANSSLVSTTTTLDDITNVNMNTMHMQPLTAKEQYWATRALKAEALLAAHEDHKKEIKNLGYAHDMKRERELVQLAKEQKEKHDTLEKLVRLLVGIVFLLIGVVVYLATHYARHSMLLQHKQQEKWWSMIGASHFTIPILSPFTSVVEHESSVVGAKVIGTLAAVGACLAFFVFRKWLSTQGNHDANAGRGGIGASGVAAIASAVSPMPYNIDR
ncbi:hypothetical protein JR316_0010123 [Psilocybe cubensis]|uniref:Uncharacterized protein n=2 Tax=Psilocybe cubensis TaxID=181762 RepID=A0ACB8GQF5_PSICU|nr:hypothetical protein JR316_0010123 [Psilocybe cubensis]KAH9477891.1 hypothetical protein JR316_0010123 [Psilocybe cubensis]